MYGGYNPGAKQISFTIKGDGAATLESFRIEYNGATQWLKDGKVVVTKEDGTPVNPSDVIPTEETTIIVDLEASGFEIGAGDMHFHFDAEGCTGTITVGEVTGYVPGPYEVQYGEGGSVTLDGTYKYLYGGYNDGNTSTIKFTLKGDGTATLESFRIEYNGSTLWLKDGKVAITKEDGTPVNPSDVIPTEETTFIVDLEASGYETGAADHMHFHFDAEGCTGTITVGAVYGVADKAPYSAVFASYDEEYPVEEPAEEPEEEVEEPEVGE